MPRIQLVKHAKSVILLVMQIGVVSTPPGGPEFRGAVVTIGNFDGLHLGHQALLNCAKALGGAHVVLTFDPHPIQLLYPERQLKRLLPRADLGEQLPKYGVDLLWMIPFTREFAGLDAETFLDRCVGQPFRPQHIVAGYDFHFGRDRAGSLDSLRAWAARAGAQVHVIPPLSVDGQPVSSRRVRALIESGQVREAIPLLRRPFYLRGEVVRGAGRGAGIGFATMNQNVVNEILPRQGVYATRARIGPNLFPSVTNIGVTPTFGAGLAIKVETHVLDKVVDVRGQVIDVEFIQLLRAEMKFAGIEDLKKQIQSDILNAKKVHDETLDEHQHHE